MAEARMLSRTIAHSEQLARVSIEAAYVFVACLPHMDRDGRLYGEPGLVRQMIAPLRSDLDDATMTRCLAELASARLVHWYEAAAHGDEETIVKCLEFPTVARWQPSLRDRKGQRYLREQPSRIPPSSLGESYTPAAEAMTAYDRSQLDLSRTRTRRGVRTNDSTTLSTGNPQPPGELIAAPHEATIAPIASERNGPCRMNELMNELGEDVLHGVQATAPTLVAGPSLVHSEELSTGEECPACRTPATAVTWLACPACKLKREDVDDVDAVANCRQLYEANEDLKARRLLRPEGSDGKSDLRDAINRMSTNAAGFPT